MDRDGKIFGVVNIVDLSIVVLLVVAIAVGVTLPSLSSGERQQMTIEFRKQDAPQYVKDAVSEGSVPENGDIVTIQNVSYRSTGNETGVLDLKVRAYVTLKNGYVYYDNARVYIGKEMTIDLTDTVLTVTVTDYRDVGSEPMRRGGVRGTFRSGSG